MMVTSRSRWGGPGLGSNVLPSGTYRIGPSDFFTPGDLESDAKLLDGQIQAVDAQVQSNANVDATWMASWQTFKKAWDDFYGSNFSGWFSSLFAAFNDSNRDDLVRYETQFQQWYQDAQGFGAALPAGALTAPSTGSGDTIGKQIAAQFTDSSGTMNKLLWVAGIGVGGWLAFKAYKEFR